MWGDSERTTCGSIRLQSGPTGDTTVVSDAWARIDNDGWVRLGNIRGWEAFEFAVLTELVDGAPRITGLKIEPAPGEHPLEARVLGSRRVAALPVGELARKAGAAVAGGPEAFFAALDHAPIPPVRRMGASSGPRPLRRPTSRQEPLGSPARRRYSSVGLSRETAEGWIKEARNKFKTLPPSARSRAAEEGG